MISPASERVRVRRVPKRGHYDRETIDGILDDAYVAHVAFCSEDGTPYCIPMVYARVDQCLYLHGAVKSRLMQTLAKRAAVCVSVTRIDALVLARSGFHHSMNYRSVVVMGTPRLVEDANEKAVALDAFVERMVRGRSKEVRPINAQELKATSVIRLELDEASAKIRTGDPVDEPADAAYPIWAGLLPIRREFLAPQAAADLQVQATPPERENYAK